MVIINISITIYLPEGIMTMMAKSTPINSGFQCWKISPGPQWASSMFQHRSVELSWSDGGCYENLMKLYMCHIYIYNTYIITYHIYIIRVCVSYSYHIHIISSYIIIIYTPKRKRRQWHLFGCLVRSISTVGSVFLLIQKCWTKSRLNHSKEFFDISHGCGVGATPIPQCIGENTFFYTQCKLPFQTALKRELSFYLAQLIKLTQRSKRNHWDSIWLNMTQLLRSCNINSIILLSATVASILQLQYGQF